MHIHPHLSPALNAFPPFYCPPPQGVHKILKKHDKLLPHSPCRQFYIAHLHQQPWVQGTYSDVLVQLSNVYSQLRGDSTGTKNEDASQVGAV